MFYDARVFNQDIGKWNTSEVRYMNSMFYGASKFNQDISTKSIIVNSQGYVAWDVSNVKDMESMFWKASSFDKSIHSWDISKVMDIDKMFYNAHAFKERFNDGKELALGSQLFKIWFEENKSNMKSIDFNDNLSKEEKSNLDSFFDSLNKEEMSITK